MKGEKLRRIKISVIEVTFDKEWTRKYAPEGYGLGELYSVGQVLYSNGWQKPTGLCDTRGII